VLEAGLSTADVTLDSMVAEILRRL
jgi:hypothetical protein